MSLMHGGRWSKLSTYRLGDLTMSRMGAGGVDKVREEEVVVLAGLTSMVLGGFEEAWEAVDMA